MNAATRALDILVTGGTGYMGSRLVPTLLDRGHRVTVLVRPGSEHKVPRGAMPVTGDVLSRSSIADVMPANAIVVHLVGTPQPAPVMRAYVDVRRRVEVLLRQSGVAHTVLRPWYVLGPSHRWPYLLVPMYWLLDALPPTREGARRLGLVTLPQMIAALVQAVETSGDSPVVFDVPTIRRASLR